MAEQVPSCNGDLDQRILEVTHTIHCSLITRQKTITMLRKLAREADSIHQGCAASSRDANITGAVGGGFGMAAGGLTIATGGLAAPFVLATLTFCGAAFSVGGGAWSVMNQLDKSKRNKELQEEILEQLAKDEEARKEVKSIIRRIKRGDFGEPRKIFRGLHISLAALGGVSMIYGSAVLPINKFLALPSVTSCIPSGASSVLQECSTRIAKTAALEGIEEVSQQSAASAVKFMNNGVSKSFVQRDALIAAQKAYENAFEEVIENAVTQVAEKGGNITAQKAAKKAAKKAATKMAKETATKAARRAAKSAAEQSAKTAARVTGSVTLGFGVLTSVWEGYNAYQNHCETQKESQLGRELRDLANCLEKDLKEHMNQHNGK